jgi:hypothetical protein
LTEVKAFAEGFCDHALMTRDVPALVALILFWAGYASAAMWALYQGTPPLSRPLLLILGGYGAVLALVTVAMLWWLWRRGRAAQSR